MADLCHRTTEFYRDSKEMLDGKRFHPHQLSELASAVATLELSSGNYRKGRKLFGLALQQPTENSVAQARWASGLDSGILIAWEHLNDPLSIEARAWSFYYQSRWFGSCDELLGLARRRALLAKARHDWFLRCI